MTNEKKDANKIAVALVAKLVDAHASGACCLRQWKFESSPEHHKKTSVGRFFYIPGYKKMTQKTIAEKLLAWYNDYGRELPWRVKGGAHPNPYVVLVSEFMLQQTTVKTVIPYFYRFMASFPTIKALAAASEEEVYRQWQGLGYYARARSLHATAQMIVNDFGGKFPDSREDVLKLKGIGAYTVASYLALAFDKPETVIDGNVMRIMARLYHMTQPLDEIADIIKARAQLLSSKEHPADYASAVMDLGAMVCTPKNPQCLLCPIRENCQSCQKPDVEQIPIRKKLPKKEKKGNVFIITDNSGAIFIRKRTEKGLLAGLYEFPWNDDGAVYPAAVDTGQSVTHIFTHIKLTLRIYTLQSGRAPLPDGFFVSRENLADYPFSTLMKKVLSAIQNKKISIKNPRTC